ncbi:MAG: transposase [Planctomycetia bacterium]|nr:transposase [Planctomycetia bacterium]
MGNGRTKETLKPLCRYDRGRQSLEAIAMDMWDPYILGKKHVPHVKIVLTCSCSIRFCKVIDKVRNAEYQKRRKGQGRLQGSKYLVKTNEIFAEKHGTSQTALVTNETINTVLILKTNSNIFDLYLTDVARKAIDEWALAKTINHLCA